MTDENPFEAPKSYPGADHGFSGSPRADEFRVDGDLLVCGTAVLLPQICAISGTTEDLVEIRQQSDYPSMKLVLVARSCRIRYFISRRERRKRRWLMAVRLVAGIVGITLLLVGAGSSSSAATQFSVIAGLLLLFAAGLVAVWSSMPLRLIRYREPGVCWIRGFPPAFLKRLSMHLQERMWSDRESSSDAINRGLNDHIDS